MVPDTSYTQLYGNPVETVHVIYRNPMQAYIIIVPIE